MKQSEKRKIIIIGAGGTSQEIVDIIEAINQEHPTWDLLGYLDDDPNKQGKEFNGVKVIGTINDFKKYNDVWLIVPLGNPKSYFIRKRIVNKLSHLNPKYATLIHPSSYVSKESSVGQGTVIFPYCSISPGASIGSHVLVFPNVTIAHESKIGSYATLTAGVNISGDNIIEEGVYVGTNATIVNMVKVKKWSLIAAGSMVAQDIAEYSFVMGFPGRVIKKFDPTEFAI
jgi:sugar O-acyltransferase (sialic acid O-acetyltransferase NeuD family)